MTLETIGWKNAAVHPDAAIASDSTSRQVGSDVVIG